MSAAGSTAYFIMSLVDISVLKTVVGAVAEGFGGAAGFSAAGLPQPASASVASVKVKTRFMPPTPRPCARREHARGVAGRSSGPCAHSGEGKGYADGAEFTRKTQKPSASSA